MQNWSTFTVPHVSAHLCGPARPHDMDTLDSQGFFKASCVCFLVMVMEGEGWVGFQNTWCFFPHQNNILKCMRFWKRIRTFRPHWFNSNNFKALVRTTRVELAKNCSFHFSYEHWTSCDQPPNSKWTVHRASNIYLPSGLKGHLYL